MKALNTHKRFLKLLFLTTILFFYVSFSFAQLTVTATQAINFGTICLTGSSGTVTVGYDGSRTSTGNILLLSMAPIAQPAIFEIKLCPGGNVIITFDATTTLTGSNGGELTLDIGPTEKGPNGSIFATNSDCNIMTPLRVGGTLHVPGTAISGTYTGSFVITFNQQ
ncbi:MAG: DUF4402 domain-containing protein [Ignavibacteria bacterium]|nr:DUF4402 domain-containing protein [Ignavibacteria bacterium]